MHKSIPVKQAMKILDASPAFDKESDKVEKLPAWQVTKVKSKKRGHRKGTKRGKDGSCCNNEKLVSPQEIGDGTTVSKTTKGRVVAQDEASAAVSAHTKVKNGGRSKITETSQVRVSRHLGAST